MHRLAAALCLALCAPSAEAEESAAALGPKEKDALTRPRGWPAGTVQDQLDRDQTLLPFGKGAVFVPAFTDPLDEPTVTVLLGSETVAQGNTGQRIVLSPGTYELRFGSGAGEQRLRTQVRVRELHTTVVPAHWSGLAIHIVDEQYGSLRGSYELIRVEDREYIGLGFGTDEQAGEPVTTWILRPGLYKIVRVGENYRARRDFATVRLLPGELTHFLLVMRADTLDFVAGGEVPEDELFRPREGFFGNLVLGGDLTLNARNNVPGLADGLSFAVRAFADARVSVEIAGNPLVLLLQVEEGQSKSPAFPWQKSSDRARLDALYVYRLTPFLGPYGRVGGETRLLPSLINYAAETSVVFLDEEQRPLGRRDNKTESVLSPAFGLTNVKEGAGIHLRIFKSDIAEGTLRTGVGARHRFARRLHDPKDDPATPEFELLRIGDRHQFGVEGTAQASARLTRYVIANLTFDTLLPFDGLDQTIFELEASLALKLTSYASVNYVLRFLQDPSLPNKNLVQHDVVLRFSVELW